MSATAPVPVWLYDEGRAQSAYADFENRQPIVRDIARRRFHASFRRLS
jgi:hypothetical protein